MKISLFSILTLAAASFAMPSMAQQTVYLNKENRKWRPSISVRTIIFPSDAPRE